jgi:ketosteroid isomerase-like protein
MTTKVLLGFCAAGALAFAGLTTIIASEVPRVVPAGADPRLLAAVKKANSDFEIAMTKSDTATIAEPYTADAVFVSPDGTATKGHAAIEQLYRDRFAKSGPALETKIVSEELMLDGDFAYERGRGSITRRVREERVTDWARFLTVWQRQPDGGWKIFRNVVLPAR